MAEALRPSWTAEIEGRRLSVFDGLLAAPDLARLCDALDRSGYTRSEIARPDTADYRHWATEIPPAALGAMPLFAPSMAAVAAHDAAHRYRVYRSYVNVSHFGDMLFTHTDCLPGAHELTALWYVCERWDHEWGGETMFYDSANDARAAVTPKPGRLAVFDGDLLHAGRPPSRICHVPRYTLALKLERVAA